MQLENILAKELAGIIKEQLASRDEKIKNLETKLALLEMRKPEKGERGEKGDRGDVGLRGEAGIPGRDGKDGKDGADGDRGPPGEQGEKGLPGLNGKDGVDGKDGAGPSRGRHRGPWKHDEKYNLDDSVIYNGGLWIAVVDNPKGKPAEGDSKDWQLALRKARDGKDGERGPPGPQGPKGKSYSDA